MEQNASKYVTQTESGKMVVLDYVFGEGENILAYQLIRFAEGEARNVLVGGRLFASVRKDENRWVKVIGETLEEAQVSNIGKFIDAQHFNLLPSKIKKHWEEYISEVIMKTDSMYLVIIAKEVDFDHFKRLFTSYIGQLVEDPWTVEFKV